MCTEGVCVWVCLCVCDPGLLPDDEELMNFLTSVHLVSMYLCMYVCIGVCINRWNFLASVRPVCSIYTCIHILIDMSVPRLSSICYYPANQIANVFI